LKNGLDTTYLNTVGSRRSCFTPPNESCCA